MEATDIEFPGFQCSVPSKEFAIAQKPSLSRLQRRAPHRLQLNLASNLECKGAVMSSGGNIDSSSTISPYFPSKDPIPLLSPLVLPSMLESPIIQKANQGKSG
ncbi:unnamed protein product [Fraxinus pennsylvanica]|uniref:Uncharacterized protein n=1 Tax=Fraxinus pennsylvanica TaxID=56036 RepID=A0AAD2ABV5_9LAMI|nr:unnamed protein product [Fraxinus pennsylvanica]